MKFRAHPLGIGIATVQLAKLPELNRRRTAYVEEVEAGLAEIPGLEPIPTSPGSQRGGYYGFPIRFLEERMGVTREAFSAALEERGLKVSSGYGLLHNLPIFAKGFDLFGHGRGPLIEDWEGHAPDDFPVTEKMWKQLLFLPVLSDPVPGAAQKVLGVLRDTAADVPRREKAG
jgi:dTDP-4-amino-4,6-dideoxygalactose transaminase